LLAFHNEITRRGIERGWMRLYVLRLNGAIAAVMYGFAYNRRFYFYQHGFDAQYSQHSAGLALMALTIRAAIDEGLQEFDFLWGEEAYKSLWSHDARRLRRIQLYPAGRGRPDARARRRGAAATAKAGAAPDPTWRRLWNLSRLALAFQREVSARIDDCARA
jgi:CelD/BcsL family acetyltransferase involved in cellulose biosynthesis